MKIYVKSANKLTNKVSQFISKKFSDEEIARRAAEGSYKGESMRQVFDNIMHDPNVTFGDPDKGGNQVIFYNGDNIGWINFTRGMGDISPKGYAKLQKYVAPEPEEEVEELEDPSWDSYAEDTYSDEESFDDEPSADY